MDARDAAARLAELDRQALLRRRREVARLGGARLRVDGRDCVDFSSNDYLGLADHPAVAAACAAAATAGGVGARAAHLVSGHHGEHAALERDLAAFTGRDRALLFSSGYLANLGVLTALAARGDRVLEDRLNHASLLDAGLLSGARLWRYPHRDAATVAARLAGAAGRHSLVVTDGVFSMDGDLAPLPELAAACARGATLVVDDAHGLGVLGDGGGGTCEHFGLGQDEVPLLVGTLGKAFGTFGAFVAGPAALVDWIQQRARSYVYTTALPPPVAAATRAALAIVRAEPERRATLHRRIAQFRAAAADAGLDLLPSATPIQPLLTGDAARTVAIGERLLEAGFLVGAIRPPTVPAGSARLRITLSALHDEQQLRALVAALAKVVAS